MKYKQFAPVPSMYQINLFAKYLYYIGILTTITVSKNLETFSRRSSCVVVANVLDCDIVVNEFELHWRHYVHFRSNTLGEIIPPAIG